MTMTSAWSLSIKTVGRRRFHSAAAPPPPPPCANKDHDDDDDGVKFNSSSSNDSSPSEDNRDIHSRSHQLHKHQHQHDGHPHHHQPHHQQQHQHDHHHRHNHHSDASESNFTITVHPDDPLYSLHEKIQLVTGLKAEEQRLIYRGRIINCTAKAAATPARGSNSGNNGSNSLQQQHHSAQNPSTSSASASTTPTTPTSTEPCVKDVTGLCDKQTIHLVPRIIANNNNNSITTPHQRDNGAATTTSSDTTDTEAEFAERLLLGTNEGGGGILGALLGGGINYTTTTNTTAPSTTSASVASLSGEAGLSLLAALLGVSSSSSTTSTTTTTAATTTTAGLAEGESTNASVTLGGGGEGVVVLGSENDGGFDTTTINGFGALGGLFNGMGIPMVGSGEGGVGIATGAAAAAAATASTDTNGASADAAATPATADHTLLGYARPRLRPANTSSTRRIRRNAIPSSSVSSSTLNSSLAAARATAARLTEADIRLPDPGSVEPVRQGLLTLHTLLGNALPSSSNDGRMTTSSTVEGEEGAEELLQPPQSSLVVPSPSVRSPLDSHRQWYRGQWLDVLDTVHQWLEATVVDIVLPLEILPHLDADRHRGENGVSRRRTTTTMRSSPPDAVVSANDLEGRRRLLLELVPRDDDDDDDEDKNENDDESDSSPVTQSCRRHRTSQLLPSPDEGYYYRPRPDNHSVQLLLIHYNGWPHRWDEWIRSDSERIRPFRTRTRHRMTTSLAAGTAYGGATGGAASNILACPTPQAIFSASPSTAITNEDDAASERSGMLIELSRVVQGVNDLLASAASAAAHSSPASGVNDVSTESPHLPWRTNLSSSDETLNHEDEGGAISARRPSATSPFNQQMRLDSAQLRRLAPLLDRLGRTLTDAAPHIAALADSMPHQPYPSSSSARVGFNATPGNVLTQSTAHDEEVDPFQQLAARASHLYFGIGDSSTHDGAQAHDEDEIVHEETTSIIDPDLTDFVNGMVNTTRNLGGVGSGRNSNRDGSNGDQTGSSLLASYLASMGGGAGGGFADTNRFGAGTHSIGNDNTPRVIRMGGGGSGLGGGPGIDIHIHAIVTGPGMGGFGGLGGFPFDNAGVGGTTPTASPRNNQHNQFFHRASPAAASPAENNDDADLFSELYSESPDPVNLHGEDNSHGEEIDRDGFDGSDLGHLFEECLSIEEEASYNTNEDDNDDEDKAAENKGDANDDSINGSMLSLSEIESHGSNTSEICPALTASASSVSLVPHVPPIPVMQVDVIGSNEDLDVPALRRSSPSFGNRLFRRTFGRLSLPSRRSSERDSRRG